MICYPSLKLEPSGRIRGAVARCVPLGMIPIQLLTALPTALFLVALLAMLLRPPDVAFYEVDRIAFGLLVLSVAARALCTRERLVLQGATWPMIGLTLIAVASVIGQPFDSQTWSLLAAKFIVPFTLFHLASLVFRNEYGLRKFELFALAVLAYLCFTSIAFLIGANSLIFPRFILDESLGYHVDRARGPFLQAVANGVSINLLGLMAVHGYLRGRIHGVKGAVLLASLPIAILATMTRAVWLSFVVSMGFLMIRSHHRKLRRICISVGLIGVLGLLMILGCGDERRALCSRLKESGPVDFREAVYSAGWEMFLQKPFMGWGNNQMPAELARHVSGYNERELYPHNTYLELLVEHGVVGLALYAWLMWELLKLGRGVIPRAESAGVLNRDFHAMWPILLAVYLGNALVVVMNYQVVNGILFTMAGMLAAQQTRMRRESARDVSQTFSAMVHSTV
jgi:O-antigen ligase